MLTPVDVEAIRKVRVKYVRELTKAYAIQCEYATLSVYRLAHLFRSVSTSFNKISKRQNKTGYLRAISTTKALLKNKYTVTLLSMLELLKHEDIPLDRWILAQAETIRIPYFTLYHCYGPNALSRYESWEARQQKKYLRAKEQKEQTMSRETLLSQSIIEAHVSALKWKQTLKDIEAPSLSAALWFMYPQVNPWYLLAYDEFRTDIMESGICTSDMLVKQWKLYKRRPTFQKVCAASLSAAIERYGELEW